MIRDGMEAGNIASEQRSAIYSVRRHISRGYDNITILIETSRGEQLQVIGSTTQLFGDTIIGRAPNDFGTKIFFEPIDSSDDASQLLG